MYKKQFKKWGFEKNLTQKRAYKLMNDDSAITSSVRKFIGVDRIGQYFKRKKAVHDIASITELPDTTWSPPVELDNTEVVLNERDDDQSCDYARAGSCKFRVEIIDQYVQDY